MIMAQNKETWVQVQTKNGSVGMRMEDLQKAKMADGPVTQSEEQKKRVVSGLMQRMLDLKEEA